MSPRFWPRILIIPILVIAFPSAGHPQNRFGTVAYSAPVSGFVSSLSLDTLQKYVKELSGILPVTINGSPVTIAHRYAGNGSLPFRNAAQHVYNVFSRYGLNPVLENNASPYTKINVVGTLPGRRQEYVVICGHFDSANQTCPGADDNASGTAAVMEAARLMSAYTFDYTVKFIAFGGEEQGLKGSQQYMSAHAGDSIRAVINCDMIIWDGNANLKLQIHAIANTAQQASSDLADYVTDINSLYGLGLVCDKRLPGISASDHASFWNAQRSAVLLIEEYGVDFCPYYHTANDKWSNYTAQQHQRFFHRTSMAAIASTASLAVPVAPTPVELASFTAEVEGTHVRLRWRTASETGNAGFTVERAGSDDHRFVTLGFVHGNGTTAVGHSYEYTDAMPAEGRYLYRLRQVDFDGSVRFSHSVGVDVIRSTAFELAQNYPNPFDDVTTITYSLPSATTVRLTVHDMLGRTARTLVDGVQPYGRHSVPFSGSDLPAGMYLCRLETPAGVLVTRMIRSR